IATGAPVTHGTQTDTLVRDGITSTCAAPKGCPGASGQPGTRNFDQFRFTNVSVNPACVSVTYSLTSGGRVFSAAYASPYDPTNLCANYIADAGTSVSDRSGPGTYSFTVPACAQFDLIFNAFLPGGTGSYT